MNTELLLSRLSKVRNTGQGKWFACCPAHDDKTPSMSITQVDDRILIHCHAGCGAADVLAAIGLDFSVLMPEESHQPIFQAKKRERLHEDDFIIQIYQNAVRTGQDVTERDKQAYLAAVKRRVKYA